MIIMLAGGRASRMGRGVLSIDKTKGLLMLPKPGGGEETVIDRTIRLLLKAGAISGPEDILMCVGYKAELVLERYPECYSLETYDPDDPSDVLPAFLEVIEAYPEESQYVFFLGDVVWSEEAMVDFISSFDKAPMVIYHGTNPYYCECFGMVLNGKKGQDLIRQASACESMPVIPGEIKWAIQGITTISPQDCRTSCMEQWIDMNQLPGKLRVYQKGMVDDIDWDEDHQRICKEIENGGYGIS